AGAAGGRAVRSAVRRYDAALRAGRPVGRCRRGDDPAVVAPRPAGAGRRRRHARAGTVARSLTMPGPSFTQSATDPALYWLSGAALPQGYGVGLLLGDT